MPVEPAHEDKPIAADSISIREHFERMHMESRRAVELALESVKLQQDLHNTAHNAEHEAHLRIHGVEKAQLVDTRQAMEVRLTALNALRAEVTQDRGLLVPRELLDSTVQTLETKIGANTVVLGKLNEELASMRGRSAAFAVVIAILLPLFSILFTYVVR